MSNLDIKNILPTYQELIDNLAAAEQLEWEATTFNDMAEKRKANLYYFSIGGIFTITSVYLVAVLDVFSGFAFEKSLLSVFAGSAVLGMGVLIFRTESKSQESLFEEARFRRKLALELIRPIRDILFLAAEEHSFSVYQLTSLQIRLSRFPIEESRRQKG